MSLYKLTPTALLAIQPDSMNNLGIRERQDLQRVLRENIEAVSPGTIVIAEEFSAWEGSRRRIDLLGIDAEGNLVVIELKRTDDGGHMDLQAIRYAAMVSTLTFDRVVEIFQFHLKQNRKEGDAKEILLKHLGWDAEDDAEIAAQIKIVLVSADFGQEITTAVLWLNEQGLDIRCVRLVPYQNGEDVILDIQQIIPLPEASDYMIRVKEKRQEARNVKAAGATGRDFTKYRVISGDMELSNLGKGRAILAVVTFAHALGASPEQILKTIGQKQPRFYSVPGNIDNEEDFIAAATEQAGKPGGSRFDRKRWFTADEDLIFDNGRTYAFSTQWGQWTEQKMSAIVSAHGLGKIRFLKDDESAE